MDAQAVFFRNLLGMNKTFGTAAMEDPRAVTKVNDVNNDGDLKEALDAVSKIFDKKKAADQKEIADLKAELKRQAEKISQLESTISAKDEQIAKQAEEMEQVESLKAECMAKDESIGFLETENAHLEARAKFEKAAFIKQLTKTEKELETFMRQLQLMMARCDILSEEVKNSVLKHSVSKSEESLDLDEDFLEMAESAESSDLIVVTSEVESEATSSADLVQAEKSPLADLEVNAFIDSLGTSSVIIEREISSSDASAKPIGQHPLDPEKVKYLASAYADALSNGALDAKPKEEPRNKFEPISETPLAELKEVSSISSAASTEFEPDLSLSPASAAEYVPETKKLKGRRSRRSASEILDKALGIKPCK